MSAILVVVDERERFETAIASNPDDDAAYLVYSDWLQQRGDPRGELIMLQHRGHQAAANDLLSRHSNYFYGTLSSRPSLLDATWHLGFLRACRFALDGDRGPGHEQRALAALETLLVLPSARFLRDLSIGIMNVPYNNYDGAIEVLARHDLGSLERLALGDGIEHSTATATDAFTTEIGRTRPLYAAAPNLTTLILRSTEHLDLDGIELPRLSELRVSGGGRWLHTLLRVPLPELHTLELTDSFLVEDDAAWNALLSGASFPKLRHLAIGVQSYWTGRVGSLIANAPVLRQLHTLDLSETILVEADLDAILAYAGAFSHLEKLDLGSVWSVLNEEDAKALHRLCARVDLRSPSPG